MKRGFKAEAERQAIFYRRLLNLKEHDPLPARQLAEHLKIRLLTPKDILQITNELLNVLLITGRNSWSAAIFVKNDQHFIIHNPTHSNFRQESDLMHEIAHLICGHELKDLETAIKGCMLPLRKYDKDQEDEAEWLGSCLQLPQKALFYHYKIKKMKEEQISKLFNASAQMVRYRISVSGIRKINWRK